MSPTVLPSRKRAEKLYITHMTHDYTLQRIADHPGLHSTTVSRIVKALIPSVVSRLATKGRTDRSLAEIERRLVERNK
jgi:hypothetical protein